MALLAVTTVPVQRETQLVRGLDYYYRTVFEVHDQSLGAQSTVLGGGRYDGLTQRVGGSPTPAVGFAGGADRLLLALGDRFHPMMAPSAYVAQVGSGHEAFTMAELLRREGIPVEVDLMARSLRAQMKDAARRARVVVVAGGSEWQTGAVIVRDLRTGAEAEVAREQLPQVLRAMMDGPAEDSTTSGGE
jgi:histidyl-tRNA synthetase